MAMAKEPKKLDDLFHDTLKDIYFAEKKILMALPKMAKAAHSQDLRAAFEKHHSETQGQVERLEKVFDMIGKKPQGKTCDAIIGLKLLPPRLTRARNVTKPSRSVRIAL
jgi:ferritin-like metal-binding protein YciE